MENPGVARSKSSNSPGLNPFSEKKTSLQAGKVQNLEDILPGANHMKHIQKAWLQPVMCKKTMKIPVGKVGKCKAIHRLPASNLLCGLNKVVKWVRIPRLEQVLVAFPLFLGTKGCRGEIERAQRVF
jgi:hypothetical protein